MEASDDEDLISGNPIEEAVGKAAKSHSSDVVHDDREPHGVLGDARNLSFGFEFKSRAQARPRKSYQSNASMNASRAGGMNRTEAVPSCAALVQL